VAKLSPNGSTLLFSTFLGGTSGEISTASQVDEAGNVIVSGNTASPAFPTTPGAYDTSFNGDVDTFISKLNPDGSALIYSTFLGGSSNDNVLSLDMDGSGNVTMGGATSSINFPISPSAYDPSYNGGNADMFVSRSESGRQHLLSALSQGA
jgi:hypothetical protein